MEESSVPDLSVGLSRLHPLPQRRLHLVSQHLTQTVLGVEGVVVVLDGLRDRDTETQRDRDTVV